MKGYSLSALIAAGLLAGGLAVTSASAADLGGNCCADLEERISELEATTVRKGNRKVSLTLSGWVAQQVTWWDDGAESNAYVTGIGTTLATHTKFTGEAQITPGWTAGYVLHIEWEANDPLLGLNQNVDDNPTNVFINQSYWFIKSDRLGKFSLGHLSPASDNTAILVDGSGSLVPANWVLFEGAGFFTRSGGGDNTTKWADISFCNFSGLGIGGDCVAGPGNFVRYDSPTFGGFSVSADWGEDDIWDVAARFAGEAAGFKLAVAASDAETTDNNPLIFGTTGITTSYFQIGAYLQHVPTGLWAYGAYGREDAGDLHDALGIGFLDDHPERWYVKAGIRQRWSSLGHTVIYGEYAKGDDQISPFAANLGIFDAEQKVWGAGIVQEIDAAAMSIWLKYRNFDGEATDDGGKFDFEELHQVTFGALISF